MIKINIRDIGTLLVKKASDNDVEGIVEISKTADHFKMSEYVNEIDADELRFWISDTRSKVLVGFINEEMVGYAYGFEISKKWFFFDAIVITPSFRGKGLGSIIYQILREDCKKNGFQLIQGLVKDGKKSKLAYWLNRGFEPGSKCIWVEDWLDE